MSIWAFVVFGVAGLLALVFLYVWGPRRWYWHVLSGILAAVVGLTPVPPALNTWTGSLIIGFFFILLAVWAVAAPFFCCRRRTR